MTRNSNTSGWTLDQGLAAQYGAHAGLDPNLAANAGKNAWDVLRSLRSAVDEINPQLKAKRVKLTEDLLEKAGLGRHPSLQKAIQAKLFGLHQTAQPSTNPATGLQEFNLSDDGLASQSQKQNTNENQIRAQRCSELFEQREDAMRRLSNLEAQIRELAKSLFNPSLSEEQRRAVENRIAELNSDKSVSEVEIYRLSLHLEQLRCEVGV
ncbi:MAG: hypothetical protein RIB43_17245 [Rhodospirillaceae bacterium]